MEFLVDLDGVMRDREASLFDAMHSPLEEEMYYRLHARLHMPLPDRLDAMEVSLVQFLENSHDVLARNTRLAGATGVGVASHH